MRNISVMIKPASSLCNLRCRYCFYAEVSERRDCRSYGLMRRETAERIIENNFRDLERGDSVTLAFQGGEPTLAGLDFFRFFAERVDAVRDGVRVSWALQTNGTLLDGDRCAFLKEKDFLVGRSLDAMQDSHDENRVDAEGKGTYARVSAARALLEKHGVAYIVLTVLTNALARHPQQVWKYLCKEKIRYVQFVPCLGGLDGAATRYSLTPERFASFYTQLFRLWHADFMQGKYRSVKLFDDLIRLLFAGQHRLEKPAADQRAREELRTGTGIKSVQQQTVSVHAVAAAFRHSSFDFAELRGFHSCDLVQSIPPFVLCCFYRHPADDADRPKNSFSPIFVLDVCFVGFFIDCLHFFAGSG